MNFLHILAIFAVTAVISACIRYAKYRYNAWLWRLAKKNFRLLRAEDVIRYALPKSVVLTSAAWIIVTLPVLAVALAGAIVGSRIQIFAEE
jgi:hypothetical protein